jgi:peptidoglycan/xylan/chitin deacetylase (PgdA/CDA1 family)
VVVGHARRLSAWGYHMITHARSVPSARRGGRLRAHLALVTATLALVAGGALSPPAATAADSPTTVSFTFNDGLISQYQYARPVLKSHGMNGTFYVASNWVLSTDAHYMRSYQLDDLYRDGNEIGGMGKDHKNLTQTYNSDPAQDLAYKQDQVCGDRQTLSSWGYDPQSFAYPSAAVDSAAESIVKGCGYRSGRAIGGLSATGPTYAETVPPADPFRVRTANLPAGAISLSTLQGAVTAASSHGGGWLPLTFNQVCHQADPAYSTCMSSAKPIDDAVLSSFLDWLQNGAPAGVSVATVRAVMGAAGGSPLPPRTTVASLTFDDGLTSQYQAHSTLASHGVTGTYYINSGPVDAGESGTMSWAQVKQLASAGEDIGGHDRDHVDLTDTSTSFDYKWHQVCDDRARLESQGLWPVSFAYPFAKFNSVAEGIAKGCGYQSGRTGGTLSPDGPHYAESIPPPDAYGIRILGTTYNGPITLQALQDAVNAVIGHGGGWLPMLFHQICFPGSANYNTCMAGYRPIDNATLDAFLTWLDGQAGNGVSVETVADVMSGGAAVPHVSVTAPAAGATVTSGQPTISGTASVAGSVKVNLYQGAYSTGTPITTLTTSAGGGTWSAKPDTALAAGTYTVQASETAGGVVGTSVPVSFTVGANTSAPKVAVTSPVDGSSSRTATPQISGTAGTAVGDASTVSVAVYSGSTATGTPTQTLSAPVASDGTWSVTPAALQDGTYAVQATQSQAGGNQGTSATVTFTVDATGPTVTITSPANGDTVSTSTVTVKGTAGTAPGDDATVTVDVFTGTSATGTPARTSTATVSTGSWSVDVTGLTAGTYTVQARQKDAAGNSSSSSPVTFTVKGSMTITSVSPTSLPQGVTGQTLTVTGSGFTSGASVSVSGTGVTTGTTTVVSNTSLSVPVDVSASAATGARDVVVTAAGSGTVTCTGCLSVTAGPVTAGPVVTGTSPNALGQGATNMTVQVNGSGFTGSSQVAISGTGLTTSVVTRKATQITLTVSVAADATTGARNVTVTNGDGAQGSCTGCFTVAAAPKITAVSPSQLKAGASTTVTVTGSGFDPRAVVTVSGSGVTVGTTKVVSSTSMTVVLKVTASAAKTARSMTVTNKTNSGTSTLANAVTVV